MSENNKYQFNYSNTREKLHLNPEVVVKTGEIRGDVAKWFASEKSEKVEGDITTFSYNGATGSMPSKIFEKNFTDVAELVTDIEDLVCGAINENGKAVDDYKAGKEDAALHFLMGRVMEATKGKSNPHDIVKLLQEKLD